MLWAALLLPLSADKTLPSTDALHDVATWALQFTPRVAILCEAVVMEVETSAKLYGGKRTLCDRVVLETAQLWTTGLVGRRLMVPLRRLRGKQAVQS